MPSVVCSDRTNFAERTPDLPRSRGRCSTDGVPRQEQEGVAVRSARDDSSGRLQRDVASRTSPSIEVPWLHRLWVHFHVALRVLVLPDRTAEVTVQRSRRTEVHDERHSRGQDGLGSGPGREALSLYETSSEPVLWHVHLAAPDRQTAAEQRRPLVDPACERRLEACLGSCRLGRDRVRHS